MGVLIGYLILGSVIGYFILLDYIFNRKNK